MSNGIEALVPNSQPERIKIIPLATRNRFFNFLYVGSLEESGE
jgi:hypothetical protein